MLKFPAAARFRCAAACVLALVVAGCSATTPSATAPHDTVGAPLVVHAGHWEPPVAVTDSVVLALRILRRTGSDIRLDTPESRELIREIETVLSRVRRAYPVVAGIPASQLFDPWMLMLSLQPSSISVRNLYEDLSAALSPISLLEWDADGSFPLRTGHAEFDALNRELDLAAVRLLPSLSMAYFYFDQPVHPLFWPDMNRSTESTTRNSLTRWATAPTSRRGRRRKESGTSSFGRLGEIAQRAAFTVRFTALRSKPTKSSGTNPSVR